MSVDSIHIVTAAARSQLIYKAVGGKANGRTKQTVHLNPELIVISL
jgi:hypothetical protein